LNSGEDVEQTAPRRLRAKKISGNSSVLNEWRMTTWRHAKLGKLHANTTLVRLRREDLHPPS
jgi:hypothetical protein